MAESPSGTRANFKFATIHPLRRGVGRGARQASPATNAPEMIVITARTPSVIQ